MQRIPETSRTVWKAHDGFRAGNEGGSGEGSTGMGNRPEVAVSQEAAPPSRGKSALPTRRGSVPDSGPALTGRKQRGKSWNRKVCSGDLTRSGLFGTDSGVRPGSRCAVSGCRRRANVGDERPPRISTWTPVPAPSCIAARLPARSAAVRKDSGAGDGEEGMSPRPAANSVRAKSMSRILLSITAAARHGRTAENVRCIRCPVRMIPFPSHLKSGRTIYTTPGKMQEEKRSFPRGRFFPGKRTDGFEKKGFARYIV